LSGRYLSLKEREEIAILKAKGSGVNHDPKQQRVTAENGSTAVV
jgi:phosphopantetheinyl transferase